MTSLRNGISNSLARVTREFYGKGPARTRTFICDTVVFSILDDVLTPVEHTLKAGGRSDLVRRTRLRFQDIMTTAFVGEVERHTGVPVLAYHSQILLDPDMAIEIFVLEETPCGGSRAVSAGPTTPGSVGDADALPGPPDDAPVLSATRGAGSPAAMSQARAAIGAAVTRLLYEHWGKGPTRAKAYVQDQFVFAVLENPLTTVEQTLARAGEHDAVRELRIAWHELHAGALATEVERATGRTVAGSHCQVVFDPDVLFEIFVLAV